MRITNPKSYTWRPDVVIKAPTSYYYRLTDTNSDLNNRPLEATFRQTGWTKDIQYKVTFGEVYAGTLRGVGLNVDVNIYRSDILQKSKNILKVATSLTDTKCPFCVSMVVFNETTKRWKCTNKLCSFDYSKNSCETLQKIYSDAKRGIENPYLFQILSKEESDIKIIDLNL